MFDVTLEDQLVLDDFEIYAQAGVKNIALERTFNVNVTDGSLDLDFLSSVDLAKISAIEIGVVRGDRFERKLINSSAIAFKEIALTTNY